MVKDHAYVAHGLSMFLNANRVRTLLGKLSYVAKAWGRADIALL